MAKTHLYIGMPAYGGLVTTAAMRGVIGLTHACKQNGIHFTVDWVVNESLIPRGRNLIVSRFLASGASHLLFIDADILFEPRDVLAMLGTGHPVVCAAYPKKAIDWEAVRQAAVRGEANPSRFGVSYAINVLPTGDGDRPDVVGGPTFKSVNDCVQVLDAATGFLLVQRDVMLDLIGAYPETLYLSDSPDTRGMPMFALFDCFIEPSTLRYLSEDYAFSRRWQRIGGKVWLYLPAELGHVGTHVFQGDLSTVFKPLMEPEGATDAASPAVDPRTLRLPEGLDDVARRDLEEVLAGAYDVPVDDVHTVLDIGANVGCFSAWAAKRWPGAHITAYEPHPVTFDLLFLNMTEAAGPNWGAVNAAVRATGGTAWLQDGAPNLGCSSFHQLGQQATSGVHVKCVDAAELGSADVVKLDTEGCELEILQRLDLSATRAVCLEYHRASDRAAILDLLGQQGFEVLAHTPYEAHRGVLKMVRQAAQREAA